MAELREARGLPSAYSAARLDTNLAALERVDPGLAARVRLACESSRVHFQPDGAWYRLYGTPFPLDFAGTALRIALERGAEARRALVLGFGLGEALPALIARPTLDRVVGWERDPWHLRLTLMAHDLAQAIASGRLSLRLGADLLDESLAGAFVVEHPLLGKVYANEIRVARGPHSKRRAMLASGGLFVAALGRALERRGFGLWTLELRAVAREELAHALRRFRPSHVFAVNYVEGLCEFCREHGVKLVVWEIDASTAGPRPAATATDHAWIFVHRRANEESWRRAGYAQVEFLPLAADVEERTPLDRDANEAHGLSYVGSSMVENARACRERFLELFASWSPSRDARREGERVLEGVLAAQRADFGRFRVPELLESQAPSLQRFARMRSSEDPAMLVGETSAAEKRLSWISSLGSQGVKVWGDPGWRVAERHGVLWMGPAKHGAELTRIYNSSLVNLDVGRIYQQDIVTMRVFDVLACGRLVLAEWSPALDELFHEGEVASYRGIDELAAKARWFLAHPAEARELGKRGGDAVRARHTLDLRLAHMLARAG